MKLIDFCTKYSEDSWTDFLDLNVSGRKYLFSVTISFGNNSEPYYNIHTQSGYTSIGELNEFKNQVDEAYNLLKSHHNFLCKLNLDEELTKEQETVLESIVHALS